LCPVSIAISESGDRFSIRANVLGFTENELHVSIEPRRIAIFGKREGTTSQTEAGSIGLADQYPDQLLRLIDLTTEVDPGRAVIELQAGILRFELPKATKPIQETPTAAA
jgi:HSP20 family molecular chaperone IbpA